VPAAIVVGSVAVAFAVGLVAFVVVGDEVVQREAVMAGDEIEAVLDFALLVGVDVGAAEQPGRDMRHHPVLTLQETAYVVAEAAVPFLPRVAGKGADLIEAPGVPWFCQ